MIPSELRQREKADRARGSIIVVRNMHERKALMYRLASGFVVLPGGFGTLDELMEIATWNQLSLVTKPIVFEPSDRPSPSPQNATSSPLRHLVS
ncbi:LOG family protein [Saccharothrix longispora]|uniref:LOG family protein n=1 Tax=Saccharothrix longispora TaxID=33920 RepID=UPI0028FD7172|nr:LOG family protein [Saccharothrix longispora]MDU0293761.1 LOG family protein [Saccharothrix longispora]